MLTRNVVVVFSLFVLMVEGDLDSNDARIQAMSTDKDSTSDEAPTESMNAVSPDQPDELQYNGGGPSDASSSSTETGDAANQMTAAEPAAAAANSVEEDEDESADSEEGGKKQFSSRSAKHPSPVQPQQPPPRVHQSPALPPISPARVIQSPALPPQPIVPQPKALVENNLRTRVPVQLSPGSAESWFGRGADSVQLFRTIINGRKRPYL